MIPWRAASVFVLPTPAVNSVIVQKKVKSTKHCYCIDGNNQGRLHKGEWCEMHHGENWGGNVIMIMMLLLVSIIIYYYINTFITLHQCTFNLLFALFVYINLPTIVVARQQCITS